MKKLLLLCFTSSTYFLMAQSPGDSLFNDTIVHTIDINFSQGNYWTLLSDNKSNDDANGTSSYIPATLSIDGQQLDSVGIQFKGNSSYYNYPTNKKPFTLSFNEYISGQKYNGLKNINLNNLYQDPSFMREKLFLDFCQEKDINAPRANYAKLYINGTYWGLYLMVERINKVFLKDRFDDNDGNLFKGDKGSPPCADLKYQGQSASSYYNCYDLKTNETTNDWTDLVNLTEKINNTSDTEFNDTLDAVMNTGSFISAWAAYNLFVDFDSYPYRFIHNYYIYHDSTTNKFEWIVWDASTAFGLDVPGTISSVEATSVLYITPSASDRPLVNRMLADSTYRDAYLQTVCSFANNDFLPSVLNPKIDLLYNRIKNDVYTDPLKMYSNIDFDTNIDSDNGSTPGLKSFIMNRSANVLNELNILNYTGCPAITASVSENSLTTQQVSVYPNPAWNSIHVYSNNKQPVVFELYTATGTKILVETITDYNSEISISELSIGMYYYRIVLTNNEVNSGKLMISY